MANELKDEFETEIINKDIKIYACGDLHGDIFAAIIALRDCCKVIKKKNGFGFDQNKIDSDLIKFMEMDLEDKNYIDDLNYEWIGGNSHVVFCGDLIDNSRSGDDTPGMYFLEEIKLLKFINAIYKQANNKGGKIIKLCGNHDVWNLFNFNEIIDENIKRYINPQDYQTDDGKNFFKKNFILKNGKYNRLTFFTHEEGRKLYYTGGCGLMAKINDFVFVHGSILDDKLTDIKNLNKRFLNTLKTNNLNKDECKIDYLSKEEIDFLQGFGKQNVNGQERESILWDRSIGDPKIYKNNQIDIDDTKYLEHCSEIKKRINSFCEESLPCNEKTRIVVGHCPQHFNQINNPGQENFTFGNLESYDDMTEILTAPVFRGKREREPTKHNQAGIYFGITTNCSIKNNDDPLIYKIDVAMSKAFKIEDKTLFKSKFIEDYKSMTPQVLSIISKGDDYEVKIIRSRLANTIIHINDPKINEYFKEDDVLDLISEDGKKKRK